MTSSGPFGPTDQVDTAYLTDLARAKDGGGAATPEMYDPPAEKVDDLYDELVTLRRDRDDIAEERARLLEQLRHLAAERDHIAEQWAESRTEGAQARNAANTYSATVDEQIRIIAEQTRTLYDALEERDKAQAEVNRLRPIVDKAIHIREAFARSGTQPGAAELQQCLYQLANMVDSSRSRLRSDVQEETTTDAQ